MMPKWWSLLVALIFIWLSVLVVYFPGLSGGFVFDDVANITADPHIAIHDVHLNTLREAALSGSSGPLGRPVSMMSFAVNHYLSGFNPYYFKLTNLVIHLLNGAGIFVLTRMLLSFYRRRFQPDLSVTELSWVSLAVAAAWLLHPLNLTSVLYVVQRMTSLSAFFSIWGLVLFFLGRSRLYEGGKGIPQMLFSLLVFTSLAALSKENGALLPLLMLVAEVTLFSFQTKKPSDHRFLIGFYVATVVVPAIAVLAYIAVHPEWLLAGYKNRGFTLVERVMTETRVLWFYLRQIMLPSIARMGLYLDDFSISRGLLQPVSTLLSGIGIMALCGGAFLLRKKTPILAFGVLFFLAGHVLESTVYVLDIAFEHRNYLPMYGIVLPMFFYLLSPARAEYLRLRQMAAIVLIILFAFGTFLRATAWANPFDLFESEFRHHPDSVRNNIELGYLYGGIVTNDAAAMENYYQLSRRHFENAVRLDENDAGGLLGLIIFSAQKSKPIEPEWVNKLSSNLEYAPFAANTSDKLSSLAQCQLEGRCAMPADVIERLLNAALRNPTLAGASRSKVLFALSAYLINVKHDYNVALSVMRQMVAATPAEMAPRFALVKFLVALQRTDEARAELVEIRKLDQHGTYRPELAQIELDLATPTLPSGTH